MAIASLFLSYIKGAKKPLDHVIFFLVYYSPQVKCADIPPDIKCWENNRWNVNKIHSDMLNKLSWHFSRGVVTETLQNNFKHEPRLSETQWTWDVWVVSVPRVPRFSLSFLWPTLFLLQALACCSREEKNTLTSPSLLICLLQMLWFYSTKGLLNWRVEKDLYCQANLISMLSWW